MKKKIITLLSGQLLSLLLACGFAAAAPQPELQEIWYTSLSPTSEKVALKLNGSYIPKVFTLKDETPRVIFDFANMAYGRAIKNITTNGAIVKRIRVGKHIEAEALKTRVVIDITTFKGVTYTQKFDEKSSTLTIQFTALAKAVAASKQAVKAPDVVEKPNEQKSPPPATAQAPPAPTTETNVIAKPEATQAAEIGTKPESAATTAPLPAVAADKADEKKTPAPTTTQPPTEAPLDATTRPQSETPQNTAAPAPPEPEKATPQPAETANTTKTDAEKTVAPVAVPPQPEATVDSKAAGGGPEASQPAATPKAKMGPLLESVKFDSASPKGEMVKFKLNGFYPPTVHGVFEKGVPRVICDFNNIHLADSAKNIAKTGGKYIKAIRISNTKKPEKVRVVLELEKNRSYDLQQVFFKEDDLFVIIVNRVKK